MGSAQSEQKMDKMMCCGLRCACAECSKLFVKVLLRSLQLDAFSCHDMSIDLSGKLHMFALQKQGGAFASGIFWHICFHAGLACARTIVLMYD